jgi:hypothetical protein
LEGETAYGGYLRGHLLIPKGREEMLKIKKSEAAEFPLGPWNEKSMVRHSNWSLKRPIMGWEKGEVDFLDQ